MLLTGIILAILAALLHVYIFWMESIAWESPAARKTFGIGSEQEAAVTKPLAFNQGFYNLFLAVATLLGAVLLLAGNTAVGATLLLTGVGSITAAALVLLLSSPTLRGAALKQGTIPFLAVIATVIGLVAS